MPQGGIPVYMRIDSAIVMVNNHQVADAITDVWVEANTDNLGAYELPSNFPALQQNDIRYVINAGIKESGQSGIRVIYPFYTTDTFSIVGTPGEQYSHQPVFRYVPATVFAIDEDFDAGNGFGLGPHVSVVSDVNVDPIYGGSRCLKLNVTSVDSNVEAGYTNTIALPAGQEIWLEVSYKAEVPFYAGFYGNFNTGGVLKQPVLFVTEKTEWSKVYIKLSNYVGVMHADTYTIYFEALRPYGSQGGSVYIDNVKLVHF